MNIVGGGRKLAAPYHTLDSQTHQEPAVLFLVGRVEARIADADLVAKDSARRGPPGSPSEPSHSIDQGIAERSSRVNSGTTVFTRM